MNRETRTFFYGLFVFIVCAVGIGLSVVEIKEGKSDWFDYFLIIAGIIGAYFGNSRIKKTID